MTGKWPSPEINHKNHIRDDNRWSNLEEMSHADNQYHRRVFKNSRTGHAGVNHARDGKFQVRLRKANYGTFRTLEEAISARRLAEQGKLAPPLPRRKKASPTAPSFRSAPRSDRDISRRPSINTLTKPGR
jgi:HNH endonuclease